MSEFEEAQNKFSHEYDKPNPLGECIPSSFYIFVLPYTGGYGWVQMPPSLVDVAWDMPAPVGLLATDMTYIAQQLSTASGMSVIGVTLDQAIDIALKQVDPVLNCIVCMRPCGHQIKKWIR